MAKSKKANTKECNEIIQKFDWCRKWRKANYDQMANDHYKNYLSYLAAPKDENGKPIERSHLFIPRTYEQVDTTRSRLVKSFFSSRPYVDFMPQPSQDVDLNVLSQNEEKAKLAAALLDTQLEKNNIVKKIYDFYTGMLVFPAAIMGVGWRYETRKVKKRLPVFKEESLLGKIQLFLSNGRPLLMPKVVEEIIWDDNEIQNISFFDFWPDPRGTSSDISTWRFCFHREWLTRKQIEDKLMLLKDIESGEVYELNWDKLSDALDQIDDSKEMAQMSVGISPELEDEYDSKTDRSDSLHEVVHYWENDKYKILIDRNSLAYSGDTPYWRHQQMPFIVQSYEPLPNEVYGRSMAYLLDDLQQELNTTRNQRIDNVAMCINRGYKVPTGYDRQIISKPGMLIEEDFPGQITPLEPQDVTGSAYNEETIIKQDMENVVGTPAITRGAISPNGTTATEVVTLNSNASVRFDVKIELYQDSIKRLFMLCDMNNQQFITEPKLIRLGFDSDSVYQWKKVEPDDIIGEFDYRCTGSNVDPAANKEMRRNQLGQLLQITLQNPQLNGDPQEVFKEMIRTFDVRNPQKFIKSPEKVQQEQLQAAQARAAAMNQQLQATASVEAQKQTGEARKHQYKLDETVISKLLDNPELLQATQQAMQEAQNGINTGATAIP